MKAAQRRILLGGLLVVTVGLIVTAPPPEDETVGALERPARRENAANVTATHPQFAALTRSYRPDVPAIFAPTDWSPPRRAAAAASSPKPVEPPAEPQPPPLPFRVLGRFVENGVPGMFVQLNDRMLVARTGDLIDEVYRVENVTEQTMTVVYLPLNMTHTVHAGAAP